MRPFTELNDRASDDLLPERRHQRQHRGASHLSPAPTPNTQTPSTKFSRPDNPCVMLPLALCDALESPHDDHRGEDGPRIPGDADAPRSCGILEA
jgi:hypothetical protein